MKIKTTLRLSTFAVKIIITLCLSALAVTAFAQRPTQILADTVIMYSNNAAKGSTLQIKNLTKDTLGFLYNTGNGITVFKRGAKKLNDSTYVIGADTIKIKTLTASLTLQQVTDVGNTTTENVTMNLGIVNGGLRTYQQNFTTDFLIETKTPTASVGVFNTGQLKGDSLSHDSLKWYLPDTSGVLVTSVNGVMPNKKGQITIPTTGGSSSFDTTTIYNNLNLKLNISDTASMLDSYLTGSFNGITKFGKYLKLGGLLSEHTIIDGDGGLRRFIIDNPQYFRVNTTTGGTFGVTNSGVDITGAHLKVDADSSTFSNAATSTTTNNIAGFQANGKLTRVNLGSGLAILSGVLTNTAPSGTDTSITTGFGLTKTIALNNIDLKVDSSKVATKYSVDSMRNNIYGQINTTNAQVAANTSAITQRPTFTQLTDSLNSLLFDLPLTYTGRTISLTQASALNDGYLSALDYTLLFSRDTSKWAFNGTDIYNKNIGNVGIGTNTPTKKLTVNGDALINGMLVGIGGTGANANNVVIGKDAMPVSTATSLSNVAIGFQASNALTTGLANVVIGHNALLTSTSAGASVAIGSGAMQNYTGTGLYNTAIGYNVMNTDATGASNVAIGRSAMTSGGTLSGSNNTAIGTSSGAITSGSNNVVLGALVSQTDPTASNQLVIGSNGVHWINGNAGNISIGGVPTSNKLEVYGSTNIQGNITANNIKARKYNEEFTGSTSTIITLSNNYVSSTIRLVKNGIRLPVTSYTESAANQITLNVPRIVEDTFIIDYEY